MFSAEEEQAGRWAFSVCNICRYCEGYCPVFVAARRRPALGAGDLAYLANLCHQCGNCWYACQYAPPHPFALNLPQTLTRLRYRSWQGYAWPAPLGRLLAHNGTAVVGLTLLLALALPGLLAVLGGAGAVPQGPGAFYAVVPWALMVAGAAVSLGWALLALAVGLGRLWRDSAGGQGWRDSAGAAPPRQSWGRALAHALHDVVSLRHLSGGGHGCNVSDRALSQRRRRWHHPMFYGFVLCALSTASATVADHLLGWPAPYPWYSLPVLLGTVGGVAMVLSAVALAWLKGRAEPEPLASERLPADYALIALLALVAGSGLVLLGWRTSAAMPWLLALHLGLVLASFLLLPYSKLCHGLYRLVALVRWHRE